MTNILLLIMGFSHLNSDHQSLNQKQQECFAVSMIGYDYVINSRAGLPIKRALNTVSVDIKSKSIAQTYKTHLKSVVTYAYQWQGSPHMYAINVMHSCAFEQGKRLSIKQ